MTSIFLIGGMNFIVLCLHNEFCNGWIQGRQLLAKMRVTFDWDGAKVEGAHGVCG